MKVSQSGPLIAGVALLAALGIGLWKPWAAPEIPTAVNKAPTVAEKSRSHSTSTSSVTPEAEGPATRSRPSEEKKEVEKKDLEQINQWLADESVTPDAAAKNLWGMAADAKRSEAVRTEALLHALNLTSDEEFASQVIPLLSGKGIWSEELGEKILDDLYNRPNPIKLQGTLELFQNSTGELHTHVRELLVFELGDPDDSNLSDAELIRLGRERMNAPPEP